MRASCWLIAVVVSGCLVSDAWGKPTMGSSSTTLGCLSSGCHSTTTGAMAITSAVTTNLGTQKDGAVRGTLDTFRVVQGQTVSIPINVAAGPSGDLYALGVYELNHGGQKNSQANVMAYSITSTGWTLRGNATSNLPYPRYTYGTAALGTAKTVTFSMLVGATTPADFYDVQIQWGTMDNFGDLWAQAERVYIEVLSAPEPGQWAVLMIPVSGCLLRRRR